MVEEAVGSSSVELSHYVRILRRRWWLVALVAMVGAVLAAAYVVVEPKSYTATSLVNVNVISSTPFSQARSESGLIDAQTEIQLAESSQVTSAAAKTLGGHQSPSQIAHATTVTMVPSSTAVKITYQAATAARAVQGADALAAAYLNYRGQLASTRINTIVRQLQKQQDSLERRFVAVNRAIATARPGSTQSVQAQSDRDALNVQLSTVLSQINQYSGVDTSGGTVVTDAADHAVTVSPSSRTVVLSGAGAGLVLGIVLTYLVASARRRLYDATDISAAGGGATVVSLRSRQATVPALGEDRERIRSLRERLLVALPPGSVLAVADITGAEDSSDVGVNLALAYAETGRRVQLVLPDRTSALLEHLRLSLRLPERSLDSPGLHQFPGMPLTVLVPEASSTDPARTDYLETLAFNSAEITVVVLPPNVPMSVPMAAGRLGHHLISVVPRGGRWEVLEELSAELAGVGAEIVASVVVPRRRQLSELHRGGATADAELATQERAPAESAEAAEAV
jgi:capsular polysaccharide biosynthesis protein